MQFPQPLFQTATPLPPPPPTVSAEETNSQRIKLVKNDHNQVWIDRAEPPHNFIREATMSSRFQQYPRWARLIQEKIDIRAARVHPSQFLKCDLKKFDLSSLGTQFDVILIDPPWEEYRRRTPNAPKLDTRRTWSLQDLKNLRVDLLADNQCFLCIWAGATHLDDARTLMSHWGFRRCEDITWLKTRETAQNTDNDDTPVLGGPYSLDEEIQDPAQVERLKRVQEWLIQGESPAILGPRDDDAVFRRMKEHCLVGLRGLIRRSLDGHFVHANIDTDIVIDPVKLDSDPDGLISTEKPVEVYEIIERFCLGRRKIELFGTDRNIRTGWLTLGLDLSTTAFHPKEYLSWFANTETAENAETAAFMGFNAAQPSMTPHQQNLFRVADSGGRDDVNAFPNLKCYRGGRYEGTSQTLEFLRPKSPPAKVQAPTAR
eukprot:Gregarina_sp_Poly_1__1664@NODE_1426_length_4172_cov_147_675761_g932_i1_p2_GENE_NODE_1426_length_4172_cov_147_675761_g932_i1NODE_1426_length_4172_cov_147_675761_g932_i1_p2_ORF_typecomplete_len430_score67_44MTA70/PF05063_14/1_3e45Methyltrans_SAM/PF10672_9/0_089MethyltransfD12/PF02086_15/0_2_NODE_1426_length_4172_cov_147_675761_g932_i120833372